MRIYRKVDTMTWEKTNELVIIYDDLPTFRPTYEEDLKAELILQNDKARVAAAFRVANEQQDKWEEWR